MAVFPDYVKLRMAGYSEQASNIVARTEMERGVPRTRRTSSDPMIKVGVTLGFRTQADVAAFRTWFFSPTGGGAGAAWFDWIDPRTDSVRSARLVPDSMGPVVPLKTRFAIAEQSCVFEYVLRT